MPKRELKFKIAVGQQNPEHDVIDEIGRLVTDTMNLGMLEDRWHNGIPMCPVCGTEWHGLRGDGTISGGRKGCPGEYSTSAEKRRWKRDYESRVAVLKTTGSDKD